jgi:putative ABC transport system permease protein
MRLLLITTSLMLRAYPTPWRVAWAGECLSTFQQGCAAVSATRGPLALFRHVLAEWLDLLRGAIRLRRRARPGSALPHDPRRPGGSLGNDVRLALRSLRAAPAHTAIALLTLALGIGANTGLFSVLDSLLFRPVPFANGDRLTELFNYSIDGGVRFPGFNRALLREWRTQTDLFDRIEAYDTDFAMYEGAQGAEIVDMAYVTPGLFPMLGVPPLQGRLFGEGDGREGTDARVILSETIWRERFGSRPDMVGSALSINGRTHDIVGIMPASFLFPYRGTGLWMPRDPASPPASVTPRMTMLALARLAPGVSLDRGSAEVRARGERLQASAGGQAGVTAVLTVRAGRDPRQARMLQVLGGAVAFLLLLVCANLANLSLSKALARARDVAVRSALGASRRDLIREALVEHVVLGVTGAALGLMVAYAIVEIANQVLPVGLMSRSLNPIDLDGRTLAVAAAAGVFTPLFFGLPTAILGSRADVSAALTQQSRSMTGSRAASRWRNGLVVSEVTLAMVLLVGAALMARSVYSLVSVDRGFESNGLLTVRVGLPAARYADPLARDAFSESLIEAVRRLPNVRSATAGHVPPRPSGSSYGTLEFGHSTQLAESTSVPHYRVWPDYFDRIGLPIVEGRAFEPHEPLDSTIVSESFAREFWPEGSAIGGTFRFTGAATWRTVVGVSTEVRQMSTDDVDGSFEWFVPLRTPPGAAAPRRAASAVMVEDRNFVARTTETSATLEAMKRAVHQIDPSVIVLTAFSGTVDDAFSTAVAQPRLVLVVLAILAGLGLLLAAAGLYGVLSYLVTARMREFGVRLALGARPESVFRLIVSHGVTLAAAGLVVGAVASAFLVRLMQSLLYEVEPADPAAFAAVAGVLAAAALAACWRPARRAMRVDPVRLLRE